MNRAKRQHYVPRMLLRRFADERGRLYFFDKRVAQMGIMQGTPDTLFVQKHLYSLIEKDGNRNATLESYYSQIESCASQIIDKILAAARADRLPHLSDVEKQEWDFFVYAQWKRVPDMHENNPVFVQFGEHLQRSIAQFERLHRPLSKQETTEFQDANVKARVRQNARVHALMRYSTEVLEALGSRGLGVAVIRKPGKSFVIGSHPMVKLTNRDATHIRHPSVEIWLAISHDVAVSPAGLRGSERLVSIDDDRHIRALNEAIFVQSKLIAGRSRALVQSLSAKYRERDGLRHSKRSR